MKLKNESLKLSYSIESIYFYHFFFSIIQKTFILFINSFLFIIIKDIGMTINTTKECLSCDITLLVLIMLI